MPRRKLRPGRSRLVDDAKAAAKRRELLVTKADSEAEAAAGGGRGRGSGKRRGGGRGRGGRRMGTTRGGAMQLPHERPSLPSSDASLLGKVGAEADTEEATARMVMSA
jgi:hypothetical protein